MAVPHPEVVELKVLTGAGNLRALADLKIGPLIIHKNRYIQQPNQRPFLAPPQETWQDQAGKKHYTPLVTFPAEWRDALTEAVTEALSEYPEGIRQVEPASALGREVQQRAGLGPQIGGRP